MRKTLGFFSASALLAAVSALGACGDNSMNTTTMAFDMASAPMNPCGNANLCTTSMVADQTLQLNDAGQIVFKVQSSPTYNGTVNVTVDNSSIKALSGGTQTDVSILPVPATFKLGPGSYNNVSVNLSTTTLAAAFTSQKITLNVTDSMDSTQTFSVSFNLTVQPTLTVVMSGAGTTGNLHTWSTDSASGINFSVRQRANGGTTFVFKNMDSTMGSHIIHGDGKITHQSTTGAGTPYMGTYMVPNVNETTVLQNTDGFYCHTHTAAGSNPNGTRFITFMP